jgi:hypothetical protein
MKKTFILWILLFLNLEVSAQFNYILDTITFESQYPFIEIGTTPQNIWQIGVPQKTILDSAFSPVNAIITDTINNYPANNHSYFEFKIGDFNYGSFYSEDVYVEIKHKYDTDRLKDGGYITVSYDSGQTWVNIVEDDNTYWYANAYSSNLYDNYFDSLYNGEFGFSGNSNGWVTTSFGWHILPVKSNYTMPGDTLLVRFNFISDSIDTNKEGWMIDNIVLYAVPLGSDLRTVEAPTMECFPNPVRERAIVKFEAVEELITIDIYTLDGRLVKHKDYSNTSEVILDLKGLEEGTYILSVKSNREAFKSKVFQINRQ